MGIYEESRIPEYKVVDINEKTGDPTYKPEKLGPLPIIKRTVLFLIVALILVTISLMTALIIIARPCTADRVTETMPQNSAPCEDDWIWSRGKCYYFSNTGDTWENSQRSCTSHNASLALIDNKQELDFLFRYKGGDNRWIGLRRAEDNTAWTWTNGTLYNENFFQIRRLSPNTADMERVFLNHEGVRSQEGAYENKWICTKM